jgi:3-oxoacyl-[acyl-carrier protein] reductase
LNLQQKTVVVTGSSSGIGRATALALAQAGAHVLVHAAKNQAGAEETAARVRDLGVHSQVLLADLASQKAQDDFARAAWAWRGHVDVWVNNAGVDTLTGAKAKLSFEEKLELLWRLDVTASLRLSRSVGKLMQERGSGSIVNIGWDQAEFGMAGDSGELFTAVKGAVMAATKSLARSLAPTVRVNCVAPGWIKTAWGAGASDAWQTRARREALLDRWGTPEDIAAAIVFLSSPAASFITGHILPVNGGYRGSFDSTL